MSVIHQLSPHVADLIAAGEVVERPGSVVKELLENAVDAGAKHVTVELQNGGMTFLRVTDDGCGMASDDAELAFLRHATSKLREASDLDAIGTLGFRGEALAAIASVSRIDLLTRTADAPAGTSLHLEAGVITERSPAGCPAGTTIIVRDLFYNTPARMKFMKSDSAEASNAFAVVQRQALSHPDVAFRFLRDGQEQLSTPGDGDLHAAIYCIFGRQFAAGLVPVDSRWEQYRIRGFVSRPSATRGNRGGQHFFVDGRPVRSRLLTAALEQAYQNQMMAGRFPCCVLHVELPLGQVDVNVHPTKAEVRFLAERSVFDAVHYGVLGALSKAVDRPEMRLRTPKAAEPAAAVQPPQKEAFRTMDAGQFRAFAETLSKAPKAAPAPEAVRQVFRPAETVPAAPRETPADTARPQRREPPPYPEEPAYPAAPAADAPPTDAPAVLASPVALPTSEPPAQQTWTLPEAPACEVLDTYILVEQDGQVLFIDKHAAHERILFERLRASETELMAQVLMAPLPVQLEREEAAAVLEHREALRAYAFEADDFGDGAVVLRQIPADLDESQAEAALQELAAALVEGRGSEPAAMRDQILHTIACKAAIKAGWHTEPAERDELVRQVLTRDDIRCCPHGRPVCIALTRGQLERQFRRS